ncbi:16S rRNA (cytidine(1402)-2'-O)-methyltransferase [Geomicrobium sp. JCM 19039]|uniref:16S rRNA (cytidine(1402)-2'-O)-methyltransferase n=1 Tax=Geomicrobium sp. JCM 19039 TaxID=1460636 RepID=UPI00045F3A35|nr:16S rRNA (cytidine(1402)-2'-O)-methyltransferase [Geomicrobium sp. JCM 19039]GAK13875.1 rRNA small subunit methyltransferase I [Geomicrobium sp. JCM 19039]
MHRGTLYLVPTPIGNLEDMTYRGVRVLSEVDLICAEDTRQTRKLLTHFDIPTQTISLHEHNEHARIRGLIEQLQAGKDVAIVSDAGTPLVSDPGAKLVAQCIEEGIVITPLPGANAALTAFIGSGLGGGAFYFHGFLPRKKKEIREQLEHLRHLKVPIIFYESPHRMNATLVTMAEVWGEREAVIGRELTKRYEEFARGKVKDLGRDEWRGEICFVVAGADESEQAETTDWWEGLSIRLHVQAYEEQGMQKNAAMKQCALDRNIRKKEVYNDYHGLS